jgi:phosphomannomutase
MLTILTMMRERGARLSEIVAGYPPYSLIKGQVPLVTRRIPALLMELREQYSDGAANVADGLRVDWQDRWFHVRVSQTEPVVRVICEQRGGSPRRLFDEIMERVRSFV